MTGAQRLAQLLQSLVKGVLYLRLVAVALTILSLPDNGPTLRMVAAALVVALAVCVIPLLSWPVVGPFLLRHPLLLAIDVIITLGVLLVAGPQSPFFYFTLGTAALGGLLHRFRGAALFSLIMLAGYTVVVGADPTQLAVEPTFHNLFGVPALYPIVGVTGAGIRVLLERQIATESQLGEANARAAGAEERSRLARQMHDSLGKTLHGIQLAATALPQQLDRTPERARENAARIAEGAVAASTQARQLISGLRTREEASADLCTGLHADGSSWSDETGTPVELTTQVAAALAPATVAELRWIVQEALRNVERHAGATRVVVDAKERGQEVVVRVADDGVGFAVPADVGTLVNDGHFGLVGIAERAQRVGGRIRFQSNPTVGTTLTVRAPITLPADQVGTGLPA